METLILQLAVGSVECRVVSLKFQQAGKEMVYLRYNLADGQYHTINRGEWLILPRGERGNEWSKPAPLVMITQDLG